MDKVFYWCTVILAALFIIFLYILRDLSKTEKRYTNIYIIWRRIYRYISIIPIIYSNIILLLSTIFPFTTNIAIITQWIISITSFLILIYEIFIGKGRYNNLLFDYQKEIMHSIPLQNLFVIKESRTKFLEDTDNSYKTITTIIFEDKKSFCIQNEHNASTILIPIKDFSNSEFEYLNSWLNTHFIPDEIESISNVQFIEEKKCAIYKYLPNYSSPFNYDFFAEKVFNWLKEKKRIIFTIFIITILIMIFVPIMISILAKEYNWVSINDAFDKIEEWLFAPNQ